MAKSPFSNVEEYLASFNGENYETLCELRDLIKATVPEAEERLSWGMPAYYQKGFLVQFAGFKNHIGFYTNPSAIRHFSTELDGYKTNSKNTTQLLWDQPLPKELIRKMILFCLDQNLKK